MSSCTGTPSTTWPRQVRPGVRTSMNDTTTRMVAESKKPVNHPAAVLGAAELRQQQWNHQEPDKAIEAAKPRSPADIRPQHAEGAKTP